jgi:hypothetical protein
MLHLGFDASVPPGTPYPGARAVLGYIGGNTPHVWSRGEWLAFQHLAQFPIWVGVFEDDPAGHADEAVRAAHGLGWSDNPPSRNRRAIVLDYETQVDPAWINTFGARLWRAGYETFVYGSQSTVDENPPKEGRVIALYNGRPDLTSDPFAVGHQFSANIAFDGTFVDLDVVTDTMMAHAGLGPRA